eukprot:scaffold34658_cov230-Amphora_coffeaeformis.AAC.6
MTEEDENEMRQQMWYTKEEFDSFLEDRVHTIRMWRAVGGNTQLIEPYYVVRGLEMYESAQLNGDVLQARAQHCRAVLQEQARQKQQRQSDTTTNNNNNNNGNNTLGELDWEALAKAVAPRSAWAMRQASRLALKDALEAQEDAETDASGFALTQEIVASSLKRLSMPFSRRTSLDSSLPSMTTSTRANVDVYKLKEMNRQFLQSMTAKQLQGNGHSASTNKKKNMHHPLLKPQGKNNSNKMMAPTGISPGRGLSHSNSLSLMLVRGRRFALQQNHAGGGPNAAAMGCGMRRDSLQGILRDAAQEEF